MNSLISHRLNLADTTKNVFISHIHKDDEGLGKLKDLLDRKGFTIRDSSVTSDKPNRANNDDYIKREILSPRITWASTMIVYVSPDTKDSPWVNWEIEYAQRLGKRIVGVWAHGENECDLPDALDQYADAVVGWHGERIVDAVTGSSDDWHLPDDSRPPPRPIKRYNCKKGRAY